MMPVSSLMVDSTFKESENVTIAYFLVVSLSTCYWPASRGVVYAIIDSKFVPLLVTHVHCT